MSFKPAFLHNVSPTVIAGVVIAVVCGTVAAWYAGILPGSSVGLGEPIVARLGQHVQAGGIGITVQEVTGDSRCPQVKYLACGWAGNVTTKIKLTGPGKSEVVTLESMATGSRQDSVSFLGRTVRIKDVTPERTGEKISNSEYRFTLVVSGQP